ncbi:hypothetical protein GCM10027586_14050 [Kineococcus gypseus]
MARRGALHHVEVWRDDATAAEGPWPWLLQRLGCVRSRTWASRCSWRPGSPLPERASWARLSSALRE